MGGGGGGRGSREGWQRGNENERIGEGRETDGEHKGGREMLERG